MFTLVTGDLGIVGRWRAVCVTALQRPNSDAAAIRIVVGIAAASLSVTLVKMCNEGARKMERTEQMYTLQTQLEFGKIKPFPLISASRWLLKRGELGLVEEGGIFRKGFGRTFCYLFLFNDVLIMTKKKSEESYMVTDYVKTEQYEVDVFDNGDNQMSGSSKTGNRSPTGPFIFQVIMRKSINAEVRQEQIVLQPTPCKWYLVGNILSDRARWITALQVKEESKRYSRSKTAGLRQVEITKAYMAKQADEVSLQQADVVLVLQEADGAALNLMDLDYAKRCGFFLEPLRCPIPLRGIDATPLAKNKPQYWAQLTMCMAPAHQEVIRFLGASWFTKIDLRGAYNLVRIRQGDEWKTAFNTPEGHFEYLVMPFGLANAPSVFQSFMHDIFREYLDKFLIVYLDDILIFSDDWESHVKQVRMVFQVEVDASEIGAGAVLSQRGSGCSVFKPCAFFSRKFSAAERNYDVGNRELLAMKWAFEEWRHWLEGAKHRVVVLTDHKNLTYLESAKRLNPRQARWSLFFARFDFVISYLPGSKNVKADALSRSFVPDSPGLSEPASILKEGVIVSAISPDLRRVLQKFQANKPDRCPAEKLFVPDRWTSKVISELHCSVLAGHPGIFGQVESSDCPGVDSVVDRLQQIWTQVVDNLTLSQEKAQLFANRRRRVGPRLRVGDLVWLSSRHIPMKVSSPKFKPRFIGPYRISEILNPVSFRLTLPDSFSIHNVFHRSLLRRYVAPMVPSVEPPAPVLVEGELEYIVEKILDSRVSRRKLQYLVKWKGYAQEDNSWVFASDVHAPDLVRAFHMVHPGRPGGSGWYQGERLRDGERGWFPQGCAKEITSQVAVERNVKRMERLRIETDV
ncbi:unnamed protein product [Ranitomeya imitator]|uniref:Chromo domain-containing protein n=1 Tax=Ranitomeya imitator TaxID=111125 RepID=A0ABN9M7B0_9NEOB|nr:unnamed protein product [Ranitomeya imitator]